MRLQHKLGSFKFTNFLRATCFTEYLQWLLLKVSGFQPVTLLKKRLRQISFSVNFIKFLKTSSLLTEHLQMTASCVQLWIMRSFSEQFFYRASPGTAISRSSRPEVICKKGVLRNFAKFIGKHLCQRLLFSKVAGLRPATLFKKGLWHRCFPVNFKKFLRTPFLKEQC